MKKSILRQNKGITLIALVITIIILLILAGISIAQLSGNGLFEKAKLAKEQYQNAQNYEETEIAKMTNNINYIVNGDRNEKNNLVLISTDTTNYGRLPDTSTKTYTTDKNYSRLLMICTAGSGDNNKGAQADSIILTADKSCTITKIDEASQYSNNGDDSYSNAAKIAVYVIENVEINTVFTMSCYQKYTASKSIQVFSF